ncbi:unnamed protein product [Symbiodinium sp. CCMP2592]|nr:unnamed protein product [Symbiodinium sp. CCMP2592]
MALKLGAWSDLFSPARDLNSALPAVIRALESEHASGGSAASFTALANAMASALSPTQSKPSRPLLAESALLAALEMQFPREVEAPLVSDLVVRSLSSCVSSRWPLVAGLAVRCLCALAVASIAHQGTKEDRAEKQAWTRRVIPQLRVVLEAHPKSFQVQQLVAEGCCLLLRHGHGNLGGLSALWPLLWPLVVHPRQQVATAASLALCRLTWFLRAGGDSQGEAQVPTAERAMQTACAEISSIFTNSVAPRLSDPAIHSASLQCVRLLELLRALVLYSRSRASEASGRRERREADEALIVLPQAKILGVVELLLTSLTRETSVASQVLSASSPTGQLVTKALDLLTALLDVCGTAALVFSAQLRRFLELLSDWSPKNHVGHSKVVLSFLLSLERTAPAILLRKPLLHRLCLYAMEAMQHEIGLTSRAASQSARTSRKRKAEVLEDAADFCQPLFPVACQALARLVQRGAALLEHQLVASICEQVVHAVWHGALRAPSTVTGKELDKCLVFKQICRSPESVLGLLEVIEVLVEPKQLGSKPLAPSLLNAFAAILSTLQGAFERHALQKPSDDTITAGVRTKLVQLADTIRLDQFPRPTESKGISISWPDTSAPESPQPAPTAEPMGATPRNHREATQEAKPSITTPEKPPAKAPDTEEPMEVDAVEASVDAPAATATPEVVRPTKDVQEKEISVDSSADTFQDTLEEEAGPEVSEEKSEDPVAAAVLPLGAAEQEEAEAAPQSGVQEEVFSTPMNAVHREDFQTPLNAAAVQEASFPDTAPTLPAEAPAASSGDGDAKVGDDGKLDLFPAEGHDSPSPDLCMDSPSDEN